ncbi:hypothetical protein PR048_002547 [Dryococelus australis]|uniref:Uncharacterized protein n=1 Tax=Dryococelus australis TaxID=614101 RepID=A0ABQ9ILJ6_9NEOP|nr:hypothetical protein PR048_002547 [Dryococelus australis]
MVAIVPTSGRRASSVRLRNMRLARHAAYSLIHRTWESDRLEDWPACSLRAIEVSRHTSLPRDSGKAGSGRSRQVSKLTSYIRSLGSAYNSVSTLSSDRFHHLHSAVTMRSVSGHGEGGAYGKCIPLLCVVPQQCQPSWSTPAQDSPQDKAQVIVISLALILAEVCSARSPFVGSNVVGYLLRMGRVELREIWTAINYEVLRG